MQQSLTYATKKVENAHQINCEPSFPVYQRLRITYQKVALPFLAQRDKKQLLIKNEKHRFWKTDVFGKKPRPLKVVKGLLSESSKYREKTDFDRSRLLQNYWFNDKLQISALLLDIVYANDNFGNQRCVVSKHWRYLFVLCNDRLPNQNQLFNSACKLFPAGLPIQFYFVK